MSATTIYYFSGTGNSLWIARLLNEQLSGSSLLPLTSLPETEPVHPASAMIGLVFPVYYTGLPNIVQRCASQITGIEHTYIFAVCTYGGAAGDALNHLNRIFCSHGGRLSAGFGIHMPQNAFYKIWENKPKVYRQATTRITKILPRIASQKEGIWYSNFFLQHMLSPLNGWLRRMTVRSLEKIEHITPDARHTLEELIPCSDTAFTVTEKCNGCGICEQVCPMNNIRVVKGQPRWLHHCETCLSCY
ncbi:MAG TPA: EFR1 family ferrodoxin, partial [Candidatus Thermoplasmatota archaeon]|nr:EFR1 family ferrodoxin [Candidatus Thermoplasmatota archaeon]